MDKNLAMDELNATILADSAFSELATQATNLVMGDGTLDAKIVFIGEAPGKKEDEQGLPFVGASGRFLNEMLSVVGLERKDVYITNIVKYRPPNNRDPSPTEKKLFWPYLLKQLEIIQPKVIITLGRHSGMCFLPNLVISRDHGRPQTVDFDNKTYRIVPLYHPAAALYNGSLRQTLISDFFTATALLTKD